MLVNFHNQHSCKKKKKKDIIFGGALSFLVGLKHPLAHRRPWSGSG